jgi:hypothetical protein
VSTNRRRIARPEGVSGAYAPFPHAVADSIAYQGARPAAKALLFELMRQHNGTNNNGHLHLSFLWLAKRGWTSRDVIQRARDELVARGLIVQTKQGGLNMGASRYALTWLPLTNYVGLDVLAGEYRRGAYAALDPHPRIRAALPAGGTASTGQRYSAVPADGTGMAPTVPPHGTETAVLRASTVPPDGNNELLPFPARSLRVAGGSA